MTVEKYLTALAMVGATALTIAVVGIVVSMLAMFYDEWH